MNWKQANMKSFLIPISLPADFQYRWLTFKDSESIFTTSSLIFTDDRDFFFVTDSGLYKVGINKNASLIIDEPVTEGLIYDAHSIYFISEKDSIKRYDLSTGILSEIVSGEKIIP